MRTNSIGLTVLARMYLPCPHCPAVAGRQCMRGDGTRYATSRIHQRRLDAAMAIYRRGLEDGRAAEIHETE